MTLNISTIVVQRPHMSERLFTQFKLSNQVKSFEIKVPSAFKDLLDYLSSNSTAKSIDRTIISDISVQVPNDVHAVANPSI